MKRDANKRQAWLDFARVCAILCVIICHATEAYYGPVIRGAQRISTLPWLVENTMFTIGRLGVPIFLAITGALLLGRDLKPMNFYRKSLIPMLVTTEVWIVLNYAFVCIFQNVTFDLFDLICEMLFLKTLELSHMWYMPMIIGIYVALPFLSKLVRVCEDLKSFKVPYVVGILAFIVFPTLNVFLEEAIPGAQTIKFKIALDFLGGNYGLYLFGGYFIAKGKMLQKIRSLTLVLGGGAAFLLNTVGQYYLYSHHFYKSNRLLWYSSIGIFAMGLVLFELVRRFMEDRSVKTSKTVEMIARCSFGVYLLHKPIMVLSMKYLPMEHWNVMVRIGVLMVTGLGISLFLLVPFYLFSKRAGKILFLLK